MRLLLILALAWLLGTCRSARPEARLDFERTTWTNPAVGYRLAIPDVYDAEVEDGGHAVFFRWRGTVPVKLYLTDLESARGRGLWVDEEPTDAVILAELPALRYSYTHCDGPLSVFASFVFLPLDSAD